MENQGCREGRRRTVEITKKDFIVVQVTATPDRNPSVALTLYDDIIAKTPNTRYNEYHVVETQTTLAALYYGDISNCGRIKVSLDEHMESGIRVGDKVSVEIRKKDDSRIVPITQFPAVGPPNTSLQREDTGSG